MTRVEYIRQLEFSLNGKLPRGEISDILRDYSEYFEAGKAEGKTEEEIAVSLGIPSAVAAEILSENEEEASGRRKGEKKAARYEPAPKEPGAPMEDDLPSLFTRAVEWLRNICECIAAFFTGLFDRDGNQPPQQADYGAQPPAVENDMPIPVPPMPPAPVAADAPPPPPPRETAPPPPPPKKPHRAPRADYGCQPPRQSVGGTVLSVVSFLVLLPFIVMLIVFGGAALAMLAFGLVALGAFLVAYFVAVVAVALCVGFVFAALGVVLPGSAIAVCVFAVIAVVASGVLAMCLAVYLFRGVAQLIRYCFGRGRRLMSARNPLYRASQMQSAPGPQEQPGAEEEN